MRGIGIQLDDDYDLKIDDERGADSKLLGFSLAETINQNTALILLHQPGQFKDEPALGVGIENILMDNEMRAWKRKIRMALEADGQNVSSVNFTNNGLNIDAKY